MPRARNVVLTGFMGTGKSAIGPLLAREIGYSFVDTDTVIRSREGRDIKAIFADSGEAYFRQQERELAAELAQRSATVIATGGGMFLEPEVHTLMAEHGTVICLRASPGVLARRLRGKPDLPLLDDTSLESSIHALLTERGPLYDGFELSYSTDPVTPQQAARELAQMIGAFIPSVDAPMRSRFSPVILRRRLLQDPDALALQFEGSSRTILISDTNVGPLHAEPLRALLAECGFQADLLTFPAGEVSKSLLVLGSLLDQLAALGADRNSVVIAIGGGVTGDLAGLAAALFMRGIRLMQVPTSLLAMVDASIGGKTAIDHAGAKNIVGAFHLPLAVLADSATLLTLPRRELSNGLAEVIKTALLGDAALFEELEINGGRALDGDLDLLEEIVRRCAKVKAEIISADPYELGRRRVLNLGHTLGHAIEAADGFNSLSHGQAVGLGMLCAVWVGEKFGITEPGLNARLRTVLAKVELPITHVVSDLDALLRALKLDKKAQTDGFTMILLVRPGEVVIREGIQPGLLLNSLEAIAP